MGGHHCSPGEVEEVDVPRVEEGLRNVADVLHEVHLKRQKTRRTLYFFLLGEIKGGNVHPSRVPPAVPLLTDWISRHHCQTYSSWSFNDVIAAARVPRHSSPGNTSFKKNKKLLFPVFHSVPLLP